MGLGIRTALAPYAAKVMALRAFFRRPNIYRTGTAERLGVIYSAPTHLSTSARMLLYSFVRGTRPERLLEIGTALGGSAAIIAAAMEDNGTGMLVGIDPLKRVDQASRHYFGRFRLIERVAPDGLEEAAQLAGGKFDLVFYDGPNVFSATADIIAAVIPFLAERAYLIVDNGLHYGVHQALTELIERDDRLHDCGFVCRELGTQDRLAAYNGLRLVRFEKNNISDPQPIIEMAYRVAGLPAPTFDPEVLNHDSWWCRTVQACPKCQLEKQERIAP
ncbi:O-methyltransferase [Bradyrhizobium lablabi]|uniref:O-methyltransferase n=1 Tax=Bradyrhizobium lablabi TaxID=722472 RepID=UPI0009096C40|nr:class I SAM-dependent methyltransferase [Bradyrhizobium lablabi]SHK60172.1 Methyltransferase domain-containing protein [Bradyrhizobium lablabi]